MEVEDGASPAKKAKAADKLDLGSAELTRLWNITKTNLESCKADSRRSTPKTGEFFEEALEQIDPVNDVEKEYWSTKNPAYCWRALRLLGAEKLHYFQELSSNAGGGDSLSDYLEKVLQKHVSAGTPSVDANVAVVAFSVCCWRVSAPCAHSLLALPFWGFMQSGDLATEAK